MSKNKGGPIAKEKESSAEDIFVDILIALLAVVLKELIGIGVKELKKWLHKRRSKKELK